MGSRFFPTCQVRVVRFYKSCPRLLLRVVLLFAVIFAVIFASCMLQWAAPALNRKLQSAGPQRGAPDCSGQRRASTGSSRAEWAAPDLNRGAPERSGQRRTSAARKKMPENLSEGNVRKYVRKGFQKICRRNVGKYVRKECQKICQKEYQKQCQKICQKRMAEEISIEMTENVSERNVRR